LAVEWADVVLCRSETHTVTHRRFRVLIDARMLVGRFSGVGRVVTRLVDELVKQDDLHVVALCGAEPFQPWIGRSDIEVIPSTFGRDDRTAVRRLLWEEAKLPGIIRRADVDVFHATWNSGIPTRCPVPAVLTIHDLIPWHDPKDHFATAIQRACYRYAVRASARRAGRVTTVSEYVRRDVLSRLRLDPARVVAIPNGVDPPRSSLSQGTAADRPYVLYVGGHEARKNLAAIFRAMQCYWGRFDPSLELRLTGSRASLSSDAAEALRRLPDHAPLRFLDTPAADELAGHYASARALLLLSHDEGFGLPVLEAMAHGCPVIAAANAALPEVVGNAGILVDPDDAEAVSLAIRRLITSPSDRAELIRRGMARAGAFGWDVMADRMHQLYRTVLQESARSQRGIVRRHPALIGP
jgi:glycosyltransferase involved in cell wall biosynthesis